MQLKGFVCGLAVASFLWMGVPAAVDWAAPSRSDAAQKTAQQDGSYSAVMGQEGQPMCPFQREARRSTGRCPYSGQTQPGGHGNDRGNAQGMRQSREPLET